MGLFDSGFADKLARAQALMNDDYRSAAAITQGINKQRADRAQSEELQRKKQAAYQFLIQQNVDPAQAAIMVEDLEGLAKAQADHWSELNKPRQFGPEGGSMARADGKGGYSTAYTAPAWQNGALFGGTQGGNIAPQILHEGEKAVPVEAGGGVVGVKPFTGVARPIVAPYQDGGSFGQPVPPAPQAAPASSSGGGSPLSDQVFTFEQWRANAAALGPEKAAAWLRRHNPPIQVSTPQEAKQLPSGTRIILPDGSEGRVP